MAFIYRLLHYHRMFLKASEGEVNNYMYHSLMSYDIKRNILEETKRGEKTTRQIAKEEQQKKDFNQLKKLFSLDGNFESKLMSNLSIPLYYTIFNNRGE